MARRYTPLCHGAAHNGTCSCIGPFVGVRHVGLQWMTSWKLTIIGDIFLLQSSCDQCADL